MQAVGPRVSGLLTLDQKDEAREVVHQTTTWQVAIIWPTYLRRRLVRGGAARRVRPRLRRRPRPRSIFLSVGMLVSCLGGPCDSVILMSGRSRQSLFNAAAALTVNVVGNLIFVPMYGIGAAGAVWAVTLVVAAGLPASSPPATCRSPPGPCPMVRTMVLALGTVGVACLVARVALGDDLGRPHRRHRRRRNRVFQRSRGGSDGRYISRHLLDSFRRDRPRAVCPPHDPPRSNRHASGARVGRPSPTTRRSSPDAGASSSRPRSCSWCWAPLYSVKGGATYTSNASLVIRPILSDPFGDNRIEDVGADTQAKVLDSTVVANDGRQAAEARQGPEGPRRTG